MQLITASSQFGKHCFLMVLLLPTLAVTILSGIIIQINGVIMNSQPELRFFELTPDSSIQITLEETIHNAGTLQGSYNHQSGVNSPSNIFQPSLLTSHVHFCFFYLSEDCYTYVFITYKLFLQIHIFIPGYLISSIVKLLNKVYSMIFF